MVISSSVALPGGLLTGLTSKTIGGQADTTPPVKIVALASRRGRPRTEARPSEVVAVAPLTRNGAPVSPSSTTNPP
ncbi:hypothetical protein Pve01_46360 [Planomonospora venezuelensis]|nr:hypothetical protein Pve01_46360 [Planomonospora venezuelensis]